MVSDRHDSYLGVSLKCTLCRSSISNSSEVYQSKTTFGTVCSICKSKFSEDDIELMLRLFLAYGGYFAELRENRQDVRVLISEMLRILDKKGGKISFEEINLKMIHKALLYGFTPEEYIEELELFLAE